MRTLLNRMLIFWLFCLNKIYFLFSCSGCRPQSLRLTIHRDKLDRNNFLFFTCCLVAPYNFHNKILFNSILFLLNMNFITMKWVFQPLGRKLLFEFEFVKKSSPNTMRYLLRTFRVLGGFVPEIFIHKSKGIKGEVRNNTTLNYFYVYNPTSWKPATIIVLPKNYLFSKGLKMMMIYKTCWGEHLSYFCNYIMCDIYECEFKLVGRKMANLNERGEFLLLKLTPPPESLIQVVSSKNVNTHLMISHHSR